MIIKNESARAFLEEHLVDFKSELSKCIFDNLKEVIYVKKISNIYRRDVCNYSYR